MVCFLSSATEITHHATPNLIVILFVSSILGIVIHHNSCSRFQEQQVHLLSVPLMCSFLLKVKGGNLPACTEAESHKVFLSGVAGIDRLTFVAALSLFRAGETGPPILPLSDVRARDVVQGGVQTISPAIRVTPGAVSRHRGTR